MLQDSNNPKELEGLFQSLKDITGFLIPKEKWHWIYRWIGNRMKFLGYSDYSEYLQNIKDRKNFEEWNRLLNRLVPQYTEFFRNPRQFDLFKEKILPRYRGVKVLKIWSAGCSSGEEPYSIAVFLEKYFPEIPTEILASDLNQEALDRAKESLFRSNKLTKVSIEDRERFFSLQKSSHLYELKDSIRNKVRFVCHDLLSDVFPKEQQIIFCRNVAIYMDTNSQKKLFEKIHQALSPDGFLLIGHSESLFLNPLFKFFSSWVYQPREKQI